LTDLKARVSSEQDTIAKLNAQLDDFIKTKNDTETAMLQQFMELLNEKKMKIRDQSRLLAGAKVDKSAGKSSLAILRSPDVSNTTSAANVQSARDTTKTRKPGASRTSKRKAPAQAASPDLAPDSDSDQMEIDQAKTEEQDDDEAPEPVTPEQSDNETDEEDEPAPQTRARSSEPTSAVAQGEAMGKKGVPPPRALPFSKLPDRRKEVGKSAPVAADDEDDETEDEEL
jgi:hypothetical protein